MTFTKHFEEILERCNQKSHRLRILVNKKWGPSPETILQIYKQCVRPIFEYGILSTITVSEAVITKIQRVQKSFIRLAFRLPKYVSARLLHEASGLPYVKERLISEGQNHLAIVSQPSKCLKFVTFREGCVLSYAIECKYLSEALETFYHH